MPCGFQTMSDNSLRNRTWAGSFKSPHRLCCLDFHKLKEVTRKPHCCCWLYWMERVGGLAGGDIARLKVCRKIVELGYWTLVPYTELRFGRMKSWGLDCDNEMSSVIFLKVN